MEKNFVMKIWKLNLKIKKKGIKMKSSNLYEVTMYLSLAVVATALVQTVGVDQALASANQITRKMTNIKSNLLLVTQAGAGIGTLIGLIVWNVGSPEIGKMIVKSGALAIIITFMFPSFESFLKTLSGS